MKPITTKYVITPTFEDPIAKTITYAVVVDKVLSKKQTDIKRSYDYKGYTWVVKVREKKKEVLQVIPQLQPGWRCVAGTIADYITQNTFRYQKEPGQVPNYTILYPAVEICSEVAVSVDKKLFGVKEPEIRRDETGGGGAGRWYGPVGVGDDPKEFRGNPYVIYSWSVDRNDSGSKSLFKNGVVTESGYSAINDQPLSEYYVIIAACRFWCEYRERFLNRVVWHKKYFYAAEPMFLVDSTIGVFGASRFDMPYDNAFYQEHGVPVAFSPDGKTMLYESGATRAVIVTQVITNDVATYVTSLGPVIPRPAKLDSYADTSVHNEATNTTTNTSYLVHGMGYNPEGEIDWFVFKRTSVAVETVLEVTEPEDMEPCTDGTTISIQHNTTTVLFEVMTGDDTVLYSEGPNLFYDGTTLSTTVITNTGANFPNTSVNDCEDYDTNYSESATYKYDASFFATSLNTAMSDPILVDYNTVPPTYSTAGHVANSSQVLPIPDYEAELDHRWDDFIHPGEGNAHDRIAQWSETSAIHLLKVRVAHLNVYERLIVFEQNTAVQEHDQTTVTHFTLSPYSPRPPPVPWVPDEWGQLYDPEGLGRKRRNAGTITRIETGGYRQVCVFGTDNVLVEHPAIPITRATFDRLTSSEGRWKYDLSSPGVVGLYLPGTAAVSLSTGVYAFESLTVDAEVRIRFGGALSGEIDPFSRWRGGRPALYAALGVAQQENNATTLRVSHLFAFP